MQKTRIRRSGVVHRGALTRPRRLRLATNKSSDTTAAAATTTAAAATTSRSTDDSRLGHHGGGGHHHDQGGDGGHDAGRQCAAGSAPAGAPGALEGFKGTTPLVDLSPDFKDQLLAVDPNLKDFNYAAETYDAVTIIALAVEQAKTDGIEYASEINGITRDGTKCTRLRRLPDAHRRRHRHRLRRQVRPARRSPATASRLEASYGVLTLGANNRIDDTKTTYIKAKADRPRRRGPGPRRGHPRR